jgi:predicted PurR-regulated permease PerM
MNTEEPNNARGERPPPLSTGEFARRVAIAVGITVLMAGLTVLVAFSIQTWFAVYLSVLLAIFVRSLSDWLRRYTRLPAGWSVLVVLLALAGFGGLAGWWLATPLTQEALELQQRLPQAINSLRQKMHALRLDRFMPQHLPSGFQIASSVMTVFSVTLQSMITALVVFVLGIYLAFAPQTYVDGMMALFPMAQRQHARRILAQTATTLRRWMVGQIVSMTAVGGLIVLGLYISGIPVPLVLGFLGGLLDIIPIFGPIIAAVPAVLLGFTVSPLHAVYATLVFVAANQIEAHLLIPLIQRYSVSLPPALTVFALFLMGSLFGFWGILLATPITATVLILVERIYVGDILGARTAKESSRGG